MANDRPTGLTFAQSQRRPVYAVQCKTWRKAAELNLCSLGIRTMPGKRNKFAQAARDMLALGVRMDRAQRRLPGKPSMAPMDKQQGAKNEG